MGVELPDHGSLAVEDSDARQRFGLDRQAAARAPRSGRRCRSRSGASRRSEARHERPAGTHHGQPTADDPLWYKDAIIYQLHVKSFFDANNDGVGDFAGLMPKLDYIAELGVNAIWLLPFYPSPRRDDGYDIGEYRERPSRLRHDGATSSASSRRRMSAASASSPSSSSTTPPTSIPGSSARGSAKPGSAARNFYVWSDTDQKYAGTRIIFLDTEHSNWTWDPVAEAYFWHRFYSHQPDLNFDNPQVLEGRARRDALLARHGRRRAAARRRALPDRARRHQQREPARDARRSSSRSAPSSTRPIPDRMLLAEANQWPEDTQDYFGDGDECHMAFHFPLMPRMYMALAQEDRFPITDIMRQTPEIPENCQWAIFLRNHDELTLEMVTDSERDYLWETYAADRRARINLGIRRRLAPLLERDRRRIELMNCLLLSMPGTPVIYYGDEIGMGDNIYLGDRDGVRTPMQWSPDRNGGFSRADPAALVLPPIMDPLYGYEAVNVEAQLRDPHSLLHWMRRMLASAGAMPRSAAARCASSIRRTARSWPTCASTRTRSILCVANVSRAPQAVELDLSELAGRVPVELTGGSLFPPIGQLTYLLTLPPYGFYWFLLAAQSEPPAWHTPAPEPMPEYITLVTRNRLADALATPDGTAFVRDVLPPISRSAAGSRPRTRASSPTQVQVSGAAARRRPRSAARRDRDRTPTARSSAGSCRFGRVGRRAGRRAAGPARARARAARPAHRPADRRLRAAGLRASDACRARREGPDRDCRKDRSCSSRSTAATRSCARPDDAGVLWLSAEQSNSSLIVDDAVMLKIFRKLAPGAHPEAEMSRYLTAQGFANAPPMLGEVVRVDQRRRALVARRRAGLRPQSGRWLGLDARPLQPRARRLSRTQADDEASADEVADYKAIAADDRPAARRDACGAGAADRTMQPSRPRARTERRCRRAGSARATAAARSRLRRLSSRRDSWDERNDRGRGEAPPVAARRA